MKKNAMVGLAAMVCLFFGCATIYTSIPHYLRGDNSIMPEMVNVRDGEGIDVRIANNTDDYYNVVLRCVFYNENDVELDSNEITIREMPPFSYRTVYMRLNFSMAIMGRVFCEITNDTEIAR